MTTGGMIEAVFVGHDPNMCQIAEENERAERVFLFRRWC